VNNGKAIPRKGLQQLWTNQSYSGHVSVQGIEFHEDNLSKRILKRLSVAENCGPCFSVYLFQLPRLREWGMSTVECITEERNKTAAAFEPGSLKRLAALVNPPRWLQTFDVSY
jgi:hypothetical protein